MANPLDNFDQLIKDSFEGFEVPYEPKHWDELQANLDTTTPSLTSYFGAITTGLAATGIVFLSMLFFFSDYQSNDKSIAQTEDIYPEDIQGTGTGTDSNTNTAELSNSENKASHTDLKVSEVGNTVLTDSDRPNQEEGISTKKVEENSLGENPGNNTKSIIPVKTIKGKSGTENVSKVRTGCTGLVINFDASEQYGADAKYLWNFGDGFFSNEPNPSHTFNKEGVFDVSLSVTSKTTGQISSNVVQAMIEVKEAPVANLKVEIDNTQSITVMNDSYNDSDLSWNLNGESIIDKNEINVSVADNTRQNLTMTVGNDGGCTDTLETSINAINGGSVFPRALDLSFGVNFAPGAILDNGDVQSVKIFEKSTGNLVFAGSGNKGWNGTDMSGNPAPKGSYSWLMAVKKTGAFDIYKGEIELR